MKNQNIKTESKQDWRYEYEEETLNDVVEIKKKLEKFQFFLAEAHELCGLLVRLVEEKFKNGGKLQ